MKPRAGLKLTKAYTYLADVKEHKQVIPFRRFAGGVGRASQAKQFKATQGASYQRFTQMFRRAQTRVTHRSLAREVRQVHPPPPEERGVERGREEH